MARNCGECLMNDVEIVELDPIPTGTCPRCGAAYGPEPECPPQPAEEGGGGMTVAAAPVCVYCGAPCLFEGPDCQGEVEGRNFIELEDETLIEHTCDAHENRLFGVSDAYSDVLTNTSSCGRVRAIPNTNLLEKVRPRVRVSAYHVRLRTLVCARCWADRRPRWPADYVHVADVEVGEVMAGWVAAEIAFHRTQHIRRALVGQCRGDGDRVPAPELGLRRCDCGRQGSVPMRVDGMGGSEVKNCWHLCHHCGAPWLHRPPQRCVTFRVTRDLCVRGARSWPGRSEGGHMRELTAIKPMLASTLEVSHRRVEDPPTD